jgi:hypothetical protein
MTIDRQRKSLHWFLILVKQKRIADLVDDIHVSSKDIRAVSRHVTGFQLHQN